MKSIRLYTFVKILNLNEHIERNKGTNILEIERDASLDIIVLQYFPLCVVFMYNNTSNMNKDKGGDFYIK